MVITHNMGALNAQRQFGITTKNKAKIAEKLSSGYKINRAADDAAGLAISEKMRRQVRGLTQGVENTEAGVSMCQVADGALAEVHDMLQRINELSIQAANGTNSYSDRQVIQEEINQLLTEIDRVGETTSFNEHKIFKSQATNTTNTTSSAINSANYAIGCLNQVQEALQNSSNLGVIDMFSKGFFPSLMKHASLEEAEQALGIAEDAINGLNYDLALLMEYKSVKLNYPKLTSVIELWLDSDFLDCLSVMQINKVSKNVYRTSKRIEDIRKELCKLL